MKAKLELLSIMQRLCIQAFLSMPCVMICQHLKNREYRG